MAEAQRVDLYITWTSDCTEPAVLGVCGALLGPAAAPSVLSGRSRSRGVSVAESRFEVAYDGPALAEGRMDVQDVGPALLALADLFKEANDLVNPGDSRVSLEIQATRDGSFDIGLILVFLNTGTSIFTSDQVAAMANLKELLLGHEGLFSVVRRLRGRRVRSIERATAGIVYVADDGENLTVNPATHNLMQKVQIRRRTREFLEPLERPGIEKVTLRETETDYTIEIGTNQQPPSDVLPATQQPLQAFDTEMALEVTSPSFKEGNKWRLSDGTRSITASIEDQGFLDRVARREERFAMGDILMCDMHVEQFAGPTGLRTDYSVRHVRDHISPPPGRPPASLFDTGEMEGPAPAP